MKKLICIVLIIGILAGCNQKSKPQTMTCTSGNQAVGNSKKISYIYEDEKITKITILIQVDVSSGKQGSLKEVLKKLQDDSPYYTTVVEGLEYSFTSQNTLIEETIKVDLTKISLYKLKKLNLFPEELINGDDSGFSIKPSDYQTYLEQEEFSGSCELE